MSFTAAISQLPIYPTNIAEAFNRRLKSLVPPFQSKQAPAPEQSEKQSWTEIRPYGFISRDYVNYAGGLVCNYSVSALPDGSKVISFASGTIIIETASGHLVELDKRRRVVMVKVTRAEAEDARTRLGVCKELSSCYKVASSQCGKPMLILPGNIVIFDDEQKVTIHLPNGTEFFARKTAA